MIYLLNCFIKIKCLRTCAISNYRLLFLIENKSVQNIFCYFDLGKIDSFKTQSIRRMRTLPLHMLKQHRFPNILSIVSDKTMKYTYSHYVFLDKEDPMLAFKYTTTQK